MIPVYTPAYQITLTRLVNRTQSATGSYASPFQTIDLTPYLGQAGIVSTTKAVDQPCGAFSIAFADRLHPEFGDTVYALAEPMDLIEIRAARHPERYVGGTLPLIMRGFVSSVAREETMGQDGAPMRVVRLVGQDSGKLLDIYRVLFEFAAVINDTSYIDEFRLQAMLGMAPGPLPVASFMKQVIDNVVNIKILKLAIFTNSQIKPFQTDTVTVPDGLVLPQLAAQIDSVSMWQLMETFADKPWNELWVQDQEDGPHLVFRPVPYKDYQTGNFIMNGAADPGTYRIDIADVVTHMVSRSDTRVANFYWVPPGVTQLDSNGYVSMMALSQGYPLDLQYDANSPEIFGQRKMQAGSNLYPDGVDQPFMMLPESAKQQAGGTWVTWVQARAKQLMLLNRDNSRFEEGALVVMGAEGLTVGTYLQLQRGDLLSEMYVASVTHQMAPLQAWTTSLQVIRGTGFKTRSDFAGQPYIAEGFKGPYS